MMTTWKKNFRNYGRTKTNFWMKNFRNYGRKERNCCGLQNCSWWKNYF